jgi:hypothetical protein
LSPKSEVTMSSIPLAAFLSAHFGMEDPILSFKPIGSGHINTTMLLKSTQQVLVVQKLNTVVFPKPQQLVDNARLIEKHLSNKQQLGEFNLVILHHVPTVKQEYLVQAEEGTWRALELIDDSYSEDVVNTSAQAYTAANAFGQFAAALADFDASKLHAVIPDFHNLAMRFASFKQLVSHNPQQRLASCQAEVDFCLTQLSLVDELSALTGEIPVRACHNDTKINNMLFCSHSSAAKAVIDLDTCMPGYWLNDFGDMVRTFCCAEQEDSTALDKVRVREDIFAAIVKGYVEPLKHILTAAEKQSFWLGAKVMPFMIGLRFLTDYLDGDNYFTTKYDTHNLDRARNQFALYRDIVSKKQVLQALLNNA